MTIDLRTEAKRALTARSGSVAIQIGIAMTVVLGMAGLGVEITYLLYKHRQMQAAADTAAFGGATAKAVGYPADFTVEAKALAANGGYVDGVNSVTVTVNNPPAAGNFATNTSAVEVIISQPQTLSLVGLFQSGLFNVGARAVATPGSTGAYCVLGLDPSASAAVQIKNNGVVASTTCGVGVNSNAKDALTLDNNALINGPVSVVGNYTLANGAKLADQTPPYPKTNAAALTDVYAAVPLSAAGATARTQPTGCTTCSLLPGRYAAGLNYSNSKTLNLAAGVYYIDTQLNLSNTVTVNATAGVTLVINGNYAMSLGNNVTINIAAPTTGATAGLAIASIRTATSSVTQRFSNNAILNLTGAIYFPNQIVLFDNNSTINTSVCGQVIARIVQLQNNANLKNNCPGTGVIPIAGGSATQLVE
jgi:Flp pilus assembly protein TadG